MNHRSRTILASVGIVGIFLVVQLGALALVEPFKQEGHQVVEDTGDPTISIVYLVAIIVVTGLMLLAMKYGGDSLLRLVIIFAGAYIGLYVFQVLVPSTISVTVDGESINVLAWAGALALGVALYAYPEWYVIDSAGIIMGIGAAGLFGVNFGILPALVLLAILAVYDAISVYGTEHMLTLASGAMDMRVPVVFVIPLSLSYSFLEQGGPDHIEEPAADENGNEEPGDGETTETDESEPLDATELNEMGPEGVADLDGDRLTDLDDDVIENLDDDVRAAIREHHSDRDALFIGLGDAVIPTVLVASAAFFVDSGPELSLLGIPATLPAVTAMLGTLVGLVILLWMVLKGRAHAGLPLLNGGAITGYLVGALVSGLSLAEALGLTGFL
jgi:presenilin-like A22 family membrane protease